MFSFCPIFYICISKKNFSNFVLYFFIFSCILENFVLFCSLFRQDFVLYSCIILKICCGRPAIIRWFIFANIHFYAEFLFTLLYNFIWILESFWNYTYNYKMIYFREHSFLRWILIYVILI